MISSKLTVHHALYGLYYSLHLICISTADYLRNPTPEEMSQPSVHYSMKINVQRLGN